MNDFVRRMIASRKGLFWDKGPLDPEKDKFVIVERILEFGTERESQAVVSCYGDEFVREVAAGYRRSIKNLRVSVQMRKEVMSAEQVDR